MNDKVKSLLFDLLQVTSLLLLLFTGPVLTNNMVITSLQILSIMIVVSAVWEMRETKFYRVPDVGKQNSLVTGGIYRYIRHPMYSAQILLALSLVLNSFTFLRLFIFVILVTNFLFKIRYEENLLTKNFPQFSGYRRKTVRLIPFLY